MLPSSQDDSSYETIPETFIQNTSTYLLKIIYINKEQQLTYDTNDVLYSKRMPLLTLEEFIQRIVKYTKMEVSTFVYGFVYMQRLFSYEEGFVLGLCNVFRLLLGAYVLGIKFNEDSKFKNWYYAKILGLTADVFNDIEVELFARLKFKLYVNEEEYANVYNMLNKNE
jgi:hypothetical protein